MLFIRIKINAASLMEENACNTFLFKQLMVLIMPPDTCKLKKT